MQGALGSVAVLVIFNGAVRFFGFESSSISSWLSFCANKRTLAKHTYRQWLLNCIWRRTRDEISNVQIFVQSSLLFAQLRRSRFAMLKIASGITPRSEYEKSGRKGHVGYDLAACGKNGFGQRTTVFEVPSQ
jgi:hypothetical protein